MLFAGAVLIVVAVGAGVRLVRSGGYPLDLGRPFDPARAVNLAEVLDSSGQYGPTDRLVIRGRIGEVCRSAGCWFVLQEFRNGRLYEVFVDLARNGAFTVRSDASGREALVSGRLVGTPPDLTFEADGLHLE